jgi:hypothetical protein
MRETRRQQQRRGERRQQQRKGERKQQLRRAGGGIIEKLLKLLADIKNLEE